MMPDLADLYEARMPLAASVNHDSTSARQVCAGVRRAGSGLWVWLAPCEILVKKLGRDEEVAGCRHGSQWPSHHLQHA